MIQHAEMGRCWRRKPKRWVDEEEICLATVAITCVHKQDVDRKRSLCTSIFFYCKGLEADLQWTCTKKSCIVITTIGV